MVLLSFSGIDIRPSGLMMKFVCSYSIPIMGKRTCSASLSQSASGTSLPTRLSHIHGQILMETLLGPATFSPSHVSLLSHLGVEPVTATPLKPWTIARWIVRWPLGRHWGIRLRERRREGDKGGYLVTLTWVITAPKRPRYVQGSVTKLQSATRLDQCISTS